MHRNPRKGHQNASRDRQNSAFFLDVIVRGIGGDGTMHMSFPSTPRGRRIRPDSGQQQDGVGGRF